MVLRWCYIVYGFMALANKISSAQTCPHGSYGEFCDLICPSNCEVLKSRDGYSGPGPCNKTSAYCVEGCKEGFHGSTCNKMCGDHCKTCYQETGGCITCIDGNQARGSRCILKEGKHIEESCSSNCLSNRCDRSGRCTRGCKAGFHGRKCDANCNNACTRMICQQSSGRCIYGCIDGYVQTDNGCEMFKGVRGLDIGFIVTVAVLSICILTMMGFFLIKITIENTKKVTKYPGQTLRRSRMSDPTITGISPFRYQSFEMLSSKNAQVKP